jgi:hypothetical protein
MEQTSADGSSAWNMVHGTWVVQQIEGQVREGAKQGLPSAALTMMRRFGSGPRLS